MRVRVGIAINRFHDFSNWELRLIQEILNDSKLELSLLIEDDLVKRNPESRYFGLAVPKCFSSNFLGRLFLAIQLQLEQLFYFKQATTVNKDQLNPQLKKVNMIKRSLLNTSVDSGNSIDPRLDVMLDLSAGHGLDDYLRLTKHGVWTLVHKDSELKTMGPIGFWEVLNKEETIGCTLLSRTLESKKPYILDSANFNRHWSCIETKNMVLEASVSVVLKGIRRLSEEGFTISAYEEQYKGSDLLPSLPQVIKYITRFYIRFFQKLVEKSQTKFFGTRFECWTFIIGQGKFLDGRKLNFRTAKLPKNEFWADPFLFRHKGTDYVFFENYSYETKRGKISCGVIENNELQHVEDVLDFDYHLSFPYIFEEEGAVYLMPETSENKRLEIYKAVDFPIKWELYTTAFEGEAVADAFFYTDVNKDKWLFLNKQMASTAPMNSELYIYKTDSLKLNNLQPHSQNPVIIDARIARNGGAIFEYDREVYRPSQRNVDGIYGRALNINKIKELTLDSYVEENVKVIEPDFDKKFVALHHLHQTEDLFVFDTAYKRK